MLLFSVHDIAWYFVLHRPIRNTILHHYYGSPKQNELFAIARVRSPIRSCRICSGQNNTGDSFLRVQFASLILIPSFAPYLLIILSSTLCRLEIFVVVWSENVLNSVSMFSCDDDDARPGCRSVWQTVHEDLPACVRWERRHDGNFLQRLHVGPLQLWKPGES